MTPTPTDTPVSTDTATITPTNTPTVTNTATHTNTATPTETVAADEVAVVATEPPTPTRTLAPLDAPDVLPTALPASETPGGAVAAVVTPPGGGDAPGGAPPLTTIPPEPNNRLPLELIIGGGILLVVVGYAGVFWRGAAAADRYADGFVIDTCPVCEEGNLTVDTRVNRILGVPRVKRAVRCDNCRSVLREVGARRWRYAIDRLANPDLYRRYNGRVLDESTLESLNKAEASEPPEFVDE